MRVNNLVRGKRGRGGMRERRERGRAGESGREGFLFVRIIFKNDYRF
jgi:hypothetical protein